MKLIKILGVLVAIAGVAALLVVAPSVHGQPFGPTPDQSALAQGRRVEGPDRARDRAILSGRGAEIGVSVRDVDSSQADEKNVGTGAVIEEVRSDSPAERAGLQRLDIVVEFDGEHVRSARQFGRLVEETPPGRTVKATVVRDGQKKDVQITPSAERFADVFIDRDRLRQQLGDLAVQLPRFNFDFDLLGESSRSRLGVTVTELSPQLAAYFGAKDGVLVASVTEDSPAGRAGLKAGDVITSVNGEPVRSRADVTRAVRDAKDDEVTIAIVRDKKETTVKAKIEARRRPARTVRPA